MSETPNLSLPLLASSQAQKHVTMNEALMRLDALAAPSAKSASLTEPPLNANEGDAYLIAAPAAGLWAGREGSMAFFANEGWSYAAPKPGWRVWVEDRGEEAIYTGQAWSMAPLGPVRDGAYMRAASIVSDVTIEAGSGFDSLIEIPDRAMVIGVTGRVITAVEGAGLTGWRIGVAESTNRYGSGIGLPVDSTVNGLTSQPVSYYMPTPLRIEPEGGDFSGGVVRLAVHYLSLTPPEAA